MKKWLPLSARTSTPWLACETDPGRAVEAGNPGAFWSLSEGVLGAAEGEPIRAEHSDYAVTLLSNAAPGTRRDLYRLAFEPGPARESDPHPTSVIEHLVLSTGRALIGPADSPVELGPGDYISYPGDVPHTFQALEPGTTAVLVLEHR